jgi:hypothetical protein
VYPAAPYVPVDSIGTHHATPSFETSELVMELATSRVFCRFAFGRVQPAAAAGLGEPAGALLAAPVAACGEKQPVVLELLLPLQPPTARLAAASRATLAAPVRLTKCPMAELPVHVPLVTARRLLSATPAGRRASLCSHD